MQHHRKNRKLGRKKNVRTALMRSLAVSLIQHERITTTEAKAKELRPQIEKLITQAKKNSVAARRLINARLGGSQDDITKKLVDEITPRFKDRDGGYTRIIKMPRRQGDASKMALIEFVD